MNKEEFLKTFLEDDLFVAKGYLAEGEASKFKWMDKVDSKLISTLKIAISGESNQESRTVIERKVNQLFNRDL